MKLHLAVAVLLPLLYGCSAQPSIESSADVYAGMPRHLELRDLPFYSQTDHQCGPAALAMIATEQGTPLTAPEAAALVYLPGREGTLALDMLGGARRLGLLAYPLRPEFSDLLVELGAGHPVLVLQNRGLPIFPLWHYGVLFGYDLPAEQVFLRSGNAENEILPFSTFAATWERAERWAAVLLSSDKLPATGNPGDLLEAAGGLERAGQLQAAQTVYENLIARWPEQETAWLGLANTLYAQQQLDRAREILLDAEQRFPSSQAICNNAAHVLFELGHVAEALEHARRAVSLPGAYSAAARKTLAQIEASLGPG